jgi:carbamoyl-phosphate synthase small subunit
MNDKTKAILFLEDGRSFPGFSLGARGQAFGEVVFNTGLTGYQEIITDPSYKGQIVAMTYPLIGNYGINSQDVESSSPSVSGFVVKEASRMTSSWRSQKHLSQYLKENNVIGIEGVDTRALTKHIRLSGAMRAVISTEDFDDDSLLKKVQASPGLLERDLVKEVTCDKPYWWSREGNLTVAVIDCGVKYSILRKLQQRGCRVWVVPAATLAEDILEVSPDGVLISNGPGDPAGVPYVVDEVRKLLGKLPVFGICFGQQMLGLALGAKTYKLKFGHHGCNQPVKDLFKDKISITSQNHGFCVDMDSLDSQDVEATHVNLNDKTLEGMRHRKMPMFSVQFHPEAGPGPNDAAYLFDDFVAMMEKHKSTQAKN